MGRDVFISFHVMALATVLFETDKFIVSPLIQKLWQVCTTVARKTHENAYSSPLCRFLFGHSTFSVASLVFMKGTSFCGTGRILSRVEPLTSWCAKFYRSAWFPLLFACHLRNLPCVYMYALFRLISIQRYAFKSASPQKSKNERQIWKIQNRSNIAY